MNIDSVALEFAMEKEDEEAPAHAVGLCFFGPDTGLKQVFLYLMAMA